MRLNTECAGTAPIGFFRTFGNHMEIFMGSVLAGKNAEVPSPFDFALGGAGMHPSSPLGANGTPLHGGTSVMIDMAGNYTAYQTDMTRVYAVGKLPTEAYRAHEVSRYLHQEIMDIARPGMACAEIYRKVEERVRQEGLEANFMGTCQQARFVGHGVGMQINEWPVLAPRSKEILQPGMNLRAGAEICHSFCGGCRGGEYFFSNRIRTEKIDQFSGRDYSFGIKGDMPHYLYLYKVKKMGYGKVDL